jgi:protein-L-isoaspartate O-methyltransferase
MNRGLAAAGVAFGALLAGAAWWRTHPSACPYGQRFWVELPRPLITRARLREALEPQPGETMLEVGPGTGYYTLPVADWLGPAGSLQILDIQRRGRRAQLRAARRPATRLLRGAPRPRDAD